MRLLLAAAYLVLMSGVWCAGPLVAQDDEDADALSQEVIRLYQAGKYVDAVPIAERVLAIREKARSPKHPSVVTALNKYLFKNGMS